MWLNTFPYCSQLGARLLELVIIMCVINAYNVTFKAEFVLFTSIGEMICLIGLFIHRRKERLKSKQVCISLNTSVRIILHFYVFYAVTEQWHMQPHGIFLCT